VTFLAYGAAAILAAAGTRAAAAIFAAAAVLAAVLSTGTQPAAAAIAWTAAMAAGLIWAGVPPRRLAVPAIGAAAAIAAGGAGNASIVLALWTLGTGVAVLSRPTGPEGSRWAFGLLQADLLLAATVVYTALTYGFAAWPHRLGNVGTVALLVSAFARVPAVGWPEERSELGLLLVRAQAVVLATVAVRAAGHEVLVVAVVVAAAVFAAGPLARRVAVGDAMQEFALVVLALSVSALGWGAAGWVWGALAGGTLMHHLRLMGWDTDERSALARAIVRGGGIGLPLLPAVSAVITAVLPRPGPLRVVVVAGLAAGLAARVAPLPAKVQAEVEGAGGGRPFETSARRNARRNANGVNGWSWGLLAAAASAALIAPAVALPRPPGGEPIPWPPVWAAAFVAAGALAGVIVPGLGPAAESRAERRPFTVPGAAEAIRLLDPPGGTAALVGLLAVFAVLAAGILVLGWVRGFL
jgi:hypothetical protein